VHIKVHNVSQWPKAV